MRCAHDCRVTFPETARRQTVALSTLPAKSATSVAKLAISLETVHLTKRTVSQQLRQHLPQLSRQQRKLTQQHPFRLLLPLLQWRNDGSSFITDDFPFLLISSSSCDDFRPLSVPLRLATHHFSHKRFTHLDTQLTRLAFSVSTS
jgi:hypothetical protein